jgi:predicted SnoaL-like aldol condensation-catalyzing enzyme
MADIEQSRQTVLAVYTRAFNAKQPVDTVERYVGDRYIQHNPQAPTAPRRSSSSWARSPRSSPT